MCAVSTTGEVYVRMAGRRERARVVVVVLVVEEEERIEEAVLVAGGPRRERSSMKFPTARFEGVRGRCRVRVMS